MFATLVALNVTNRSGSSTTKTSGVPGGSVEAMRPASVAAARSSGDTNGCWSRWASIAGRANRPRSTTVTPSVSQRRGSVRSHNQVNPCAARIGIANPNVSTRSGGNHPVARPRGTPATVTTAHASRKRRVNP